MIFNLFYSSIFTFHKVKPSATDSDYHKAFPFLSSQETVDGWKMEILMYMATSEDVSTEIDLIAGWTEDGNTHVHSY